MNYFSIEDDLSRELEHMSPTERTGRIKGEQQWRCVVHDTEERNELPIENPGSQPDWLQLMREGIPDSADQARHYRYTHYRGVVLDPDELRALTFDDLAVLAQGKVSRSMLMMATRRKSQRARFIEALLGTLERNEIYIPAHTTIALLVKSIREQQGEYETEIGFQTDVNMYELYLMRYHPFLGFIRATNPTVIEYGICQGCKDLMPVNAMCARVTNAGFLRPRQYCESVGPKMEYFVPQQLRKEIDLLQKHPQLQNHCRQIAEYLVPVANQRAVVDCYKSYTHIQLDASTYDQPSDAVFKDINALLDENYFHNNPKAFYEIYEEIYNATRCSKSEAIDTVTQWIVGWQAKDPNYFTTMQLISLDRAKETFLENVDSDTEDSENEE